MKKQFAFILMGCLIATTVFAAATIKQAKHTQSKCEICSAEDETCYPIPC